MEIHKIWLLCLSKGLCIPIIYPVSFLGLLSKVLPDRESNPGLPRDRRGYSPLYYRGLNAIANRAEVIRQRQMSENPYFLAFFHIKEPELYIYLENQVCTTSNAKERNMCLKSGFVTIALGFLHHAQIFRLLLKISVEETN